MDYNFRARHWEMVKNSNDENIDPFSLIKDLVIRHTDSNADSNIVADFFKDVIGKFLILGSNSGLDQSYQLLEKGWVGFYVEPDPYACIELIKNTRQFKDRAHIINAAVDTEKKPIRFNLALGASSFSSTEKQWTEKHCLSFGHPNTEIITIWTHSLTLDDIIQLTGNDLNYIQTDIEGLDVSVIETFDWGGLPRCQMVCTEAGPAVLKQLCIQADLMLTDLTDTNAFYKKIPLIDD